MVVSRQVSAPVSYSEAMMDVPKSARVAPKVSQVTPRTLQTASSEAPFSARQRKQVYMQSSHFEAGSVNGNGAQPPPPVYSSSQQHLMYDQVRRFIPVRSPSVDLGQMPPPKDIKVTMNAGHRYLIQPRGASLGPTDKRDARCMSTVTNYLSSVAPAGNFNAGSMTPGRSSYDLSRATLSSTAVHDSAGAQSWQSGNVSARVLFGSSNSMKDSQAASKQDNAHMHSPRNGVNHHRSMVEDPLEIIHAAPSDDSMPPEFLKISSNLKWTDPRAELENPRKCGRVDHRQSPRGKMDASGCKQENLASEGSSWLHGAHKQYERRRPLQSPKRSQSLQERSLTESMSADAVTPNRESLADPDKPTLKRSPRRSPRSTLPRSPRSTMSPRERKCRNLEVSSHNPFSASLDGGDDDSESVASAPMRSPSQKIERQSSANRAPSYSPGVMPESPQRRKETNYSDLFGREFSREAREKSGTRSPKAKFDDLAVCCFLDTRAELSRSIRSLQDEDDGKPKPCSPRWKPERNSSDIFDCPTPDRPKENLSAEEKRDRELSRSCWDTNIAWDMNAEIARRLRERLLQKSGSSPPSASPRTASQDRESSARQRKRMDMASGNMRNSFGAGPALWDDGRDGPGPPAEPPTMRQRAFPDSSSFKGRNTWHPSRSRYFESVLTSKNF